MKTSFSFKFLASSAFCFLFVIYAFGQNGRPGIECGCTKFDTYVEPASKGILVEQEDNITEGSSAEKNPKYTLTASEASPPNVVTISIKNKQGKVIFTETNRATGWGFSPDEDRFIMHGLYEGKHWVRLVNLNPDPTREGEDGTVWYVINPINVSSASIRFSPHGKYLLYAAIKSDGGLFLRAFNTIQETDDPVYDFSTLNFEGSPSGKGVAGWGFSPDEHDATFVHSYLTKHDTYAISVIRLMTTSYETILFDDDNQGEARFLFSPCGDYFGWIHSTQAGLKARLYKTDSEFISDDYNAETYWNLYSDADGQYIRYSDNSTVKITNNTADTPCPDNIQPTWENGKLELVKAEGTTIELKWSGASDQPAGSEVTAYRLYWKMVSESEFEVKELESINSYKIDGLKPQTSYDFKIAAGDATGNWSDENNPEGTFSTLQDNEPTWPNNELTFEGKTETKITLIWSAAVDDFGIEFYKILVDGVAVDSVGSDTLKYRLKNLKAGKEYIFIVKAGDAAGQWKSSTELRQTMVTAEKPKWPVGATLNASDQTETTLTLNWPAADDNCKAVVGYKICMNSDTIGYTKSYQNDYLVKELEEGIAYTFEIIAIDESGAKSDPLTADLSTLPGYSVFPLVVADGDQKDPDISDNLVVWWDDSKDEGDIYAYDLEKDTIIQITDEPHAQFGPVVSGERIVWTDTRNGNWDIYMYDPELGEVPVCTNPASQDLPAIDGDIIVWRDGRNGDFDIYMYNIKTKTESPVSTHRAKQNWPDVSGNYVVYADDRNGNWDIFMYGIYEHKETAVCTNSADQTYPVVTGKHLWDLAIAYMDNRDGDNIYVYYPNFVQGQDYEFLVPLDQSPATGQYYPHLEDKQLVFQDKLGGAGTDWNIYAYKFRTDSNGKKIGICVDPIESADQTRPRTSKGNIVWEDERNGNSDIYIWKRPAGTDLQISLREITDPIVVGDTLRYIVTVTNDGPGINTLITAECTLPVMAKFIRATADAGAVINVGKTITWNIDTLRNGAKADLEITLVTFDLAILDFKASVKSSAFDPDPSNNEISETTKVKNFVPGFVGEGTFPSMHVEKNGRVHIVYFGNDSSLVYATRTRKGKWEYKTLETFIGGRENDMLLDVNGNIQVVMSDRRYEAVPYSRLYHGTLTSSGQWSKKIIAVSNIGFHSMSLKADSQNELHLVYQEARSSASGGPFIEMSTTGGVWNQPVLFSGGYDHIDMDIDKNDNMHVSWYSMGIGLGYQKKTVAGGWSEPVRVEPGWRGAQLEGMVTSIFTDDLQNPHISYIGQINNDSRENIKYAWYSGGKWNISMVDKGYFQSAGNKVVIDPDGKANFSYINNPVFAGDVRYATNIAGPWIKQIVDENIGAIYTDMGRDQDKYTHIAYSGAYGSVNYALLPQIEYFEIDPDTLDFGLLETGSEKTLTLKLKNPLSKDIRIDSLIINDGRISFDKTSFILNRFASDSVKVTFKQTADPWTNAYLRIWYNIPSGLFMDIPVIAKNRQPQLTIDQVEPIYFGAIPSGTSLTKTVKLSNTGYADLIISSILVQGYVILGQARPTDFSLAGHNCTTLHPGESCNVDILFQAGLTNYQSSFLKITSNDPSAPYKQITVYGEIAYPQISYHGGDIGFCLMGQSVTKSISIENVGHQYLNITGATLSGADATQFSLSNPCTVIAPGDSCKMQVTLTPNRVGDFQATLTVTSNSRYNNLQNIPLTGTSSVKTLELSVNNIDFGSIHVGEQAEVLLELRNKGSVDLNVTNIKISGNDQYEFIQEHGCSTIAAGAVCVDTVRFIPVFEGNKSASLAVTSNDSYNPVQTVTLEGRAGDVLPLQVSITAEPAIGQEPLNVVFYSRITGGQPPYSYLWEFDDLKSSTEASPVHTFTGPCIFQVSLKLTDINNQTVTSIVEVAVSEAGIPAVLAKANPETGEIPLTVQFDAIVTGGNPPVTFLWEFRDGSTSTLQNPVHSYPTPGTYTARITVTDNDGDISRDSILIKAIWNNSLAGQIWDETGINPILKSNAVLYPESDINDTTLLKLDGVNSYLFPGLPAAKHTVLAIPDPVAYPEDLPTYLGDNIMMYNAMWVQVSGHITGKNIKLIKKPPVTSGSGIISGNIVSGSGKGLTITEKTGAAKGDPLSKVYVYLQGSTDSKLKAYDISGTDGSFSFEGLENGSYYFLADYKGKPMDAANTPLAISDVRKDIEILATVGTDKITVKDLATGINDAAPDKLKVYPVPAGDQLTLEIPEGLFSGTKIRLRILDLSGRYVFIDEDVELKGNPIILNINLLKGGIYLLEAADKNISRKVKIVKMR